MGVRGLKLEEVPEVLAMMHALWPDFDGDYGDEQVMVWEREGGRLGGFISYGLRPWAEGCESKPVPYVEGWWVAPDLRRQGVGRALVSAVEDWARAHGYRELGSDVELDNSGSLEAHQKLGFEPVLRVQFFRKKI